MRVKRKQKPRFQMPEVTREMWALGIFTLLVVAAPLAFGAVDRIVQIALLAVLAVGVFILPPAVARPSRFGNALIIAFVAIILLKEFGPAALFGTTVWRRTLVDNFGVVLPWTHNPEPSRALDGLLAGIAAGVWFVWVRMLATHRGHRTVMVWVILGSAALVSIVSFWTRGIDPDAIYGLRYTPGWVGFGPFPNRNHTACLLAMGLVLGAGCACWAGARHKFPLMAVALLLSGAAFAGLIATQSRGGLIAAAAGFAVFVILVLVRFPNVRTLAIAAAAFLMVGAVGLAFGSQVLGRFTSKEAGEVSTQMRLHIWQDGLRVWKDAPIFGHGVGSFAQIFPVYQEVATGESIVLHPESSWLQWLIELGALPVLLAVVAALNYVIPRLILAYSPNRSIFMRAGPFAAGAVLLLHSMIDVPAHRWGTAGFALAALAIACAPSGHGGLFPATRKASLVPFGIAAFWAMPLVWNVPAWSPLTLARLLAREQTTPFVSVSELESALTYFPLNPTLHYSIAMHQIDDPLSRRSVEWQQHFRIAARLMPGSWEIAAMQARACARVSQGISLHYWQVAVERAGHRAEEVFGIGMDETAKVPGSVAAWHQYARNHPEHLLAYAFRTDEPGGRAAYDQWWSERGIRSASLEESEVSGFYRAVERFGKAEQFDQFRQRHPERQKRDFKTWVALLHRWGADDEAWKIVAAEWPKPSSLPAPPRGDKSNLAIRWASNHRDFLTAREYADHLRMKGDEKTANEVVITVARLDGAPEWFVRTGAYLLAADGQAVEAVAIFLAEGKIPPAHR